MRHRSTVSALAFICLLAPGCVPDPPPGADADAEGAGTADLGDTRRRECPHTWPERLAFTDSTGARVIADANLNGPGRIKNVPEFHDCQRFLVDAEGTLSFDSLFAVFATYRLARLDTLELASLRRPPAGTRLRGDEYLPAAEIVAWNDYPHLNIRTGFNCLYLFRKGGGGWGAVMVPFDLEEEDCSGEVADPESLPGGRELPVRHMPHPRLPRPSDWPAVARWDWNESSRTHYVGIRCGAAWCEVGGGAGGTPTYASSAGAVADDAAFRVMQAKGWYDDQILAEVQTPGQPAVPSRVRGVILPHPRLGEMNDAAAFRGDWVVTTFVALDVRGPANPYEAKLNLYHTGMGRPLERLNTVSLCHGEQQDCDVPEEVRPCGDGLWWALIQNPINPTRMYRCITRYEMDPTLDIPGTVRWRWLAQDEGEWMRCPQGCCELVGDE